MNIMPPKRVSRTYTQRLVSGPERVFPLLCPVREADWIDGWDPINVYSETGLAEKDCVFVTSDDDGQAVWFITQHNPDTGFIEMVRITPDVTACKLQIELIPSETGTDAQITYTHTSLGVAGDKYIESFTPEHYVRLMQEWESRLNFYLTHGTMLDFSAA